MHSIANFVQDSSEAPFDDERPEVVFEGDTTIELKYNQPSITVNTQADYAEHNTIDGKTVRQKIGENPDQISVEGLCTEPESQKIDQLAGNENVELISNRWSGRVHVTSTNTTPTADGGAMDFEGKWIYSFTIECVEAGPGSIEPGSAGISSQFNTSGSITILR